MTGFNEISCRPKHINGVHRAETDKAFCFYVNLPSISDDIPQAFSVIYVAHQQ